MKERERQMIELWYRGYSNLMIADVVGTSDKTVSRILRKYGYRGWGFGHFIDFLELMDMRDSGRSLREIGNHFGVSHQLIMRRLELIDYSNIHVDPPRIDSETFQLQS